MTNNSPDPYNRLDRIEAALDALRQRQEAAQNQIDAQIPVVADLRASIEVIKNTTDSERLVIAELRATAEALLQVAQIHQRDIETLATAIREHRRDGYGGEANQ